METTLTPVRKKRSGTPKSPVAPQLSRFFNTRSPKSAIDLMIACATIGENHWDTLLDKDTVDLIASAPELEEKFLAALCKQPGLPFAHCVMGSYLKHMNKDSIAKLFSTEALKKRNHPASVCLYGASFSSTSGQNLTKVFEQLLVHGLSADDITDRNISDVARAASLGHKDLLKILIPRLTTLPDEIIRAIFERSMHPIESISTLVDECGVPLTAFTTPKMLALAKREPRCYISARLSRQRRIPEAVFKDDDSDDLFEPDRCNNQEDQEEGTQV
jgi:hypothetical protein